jgi:catalase
MMQGFGVHTFRLVNAEGESVFVQISLDACRKAPIRIELG